jgi:hypothetical protein
LAMRLKIAEFPLSMAGFDEYCRQTYMPDAESVQRHEDEYAYDPTLSELIEACGDEFDALYRLEKDYVSAVSEDRVPGGWEATPEDKGEERGWFCWGKTPEEAVANLWLALNPKDVPK